jgi:nucleoside-diphosphate-sugar epimerase
LPEPAGSRVLVVGAAGFVGANVVRGLLPTASEVHALVRPESPHPRLQSLPDIVLHEADLLDRDAVAQAVRDAAADLVVNLASPGGHPKTTKERAHLLAVNTLGTSNLLDALDVAGCARLVHIGSSLEYGSKAHPIAEDEVLTPTTVRGAAKAAATLVCVSAMSRLPIVVLRLFSVYGPWEPEKRLVPTIVRAALRGSELLLTAPGYRRDFVYVDDAVEAVLGALAADETVDGEIVNVGSGRQVTNEEVVVEVERLTGRDLITRPGEYPAQPPDTEFWLADVRKARRLLGWESRHGLADGLAATIDWWESAGRESASAAV